MIRIASPIALTAAFTGLVAIASVGHAQGEASDPEVKARMALMKKIGSQTKILGDMAKGDTAFDATAAQEAATTMAAAAGEIPALLEPQATDPESEAKPIIWEQWSDFTQKAIDLETAATSASTTITDQASLGPAMREIGGACRACHETYRESD